MQEILDIMEPVAVLDGQELPILDMSNLTHTCTCLPAWKHITTPRRSRGKPSNADANSCYSDILFPIQGMQYSQVGGTIIGYEYIW